MSKSTTPGSATKAKAKPKLDPKAAAQRAAATQAALESRRSNPDETGAPPADFAPAADPNKLSAAGKLALKRAEEARQQEEEDRAAVENGETVSINQVELLISRDNSKVTIQAYEYEQPIYERLHTIENVDVLGTRTVEVIDWDPDSAYDTLLRKFGKNGREHVKAEYPNESALARAAGVRYNKSAASRKRDRSGSGSLMVDFSKPAGAQEINRQRVPRIVAAK